MITRDTITSKQRSKLKGIASTLPAIAQIGKGGVTENMVKSLNDALEARELIKISVLKNCADDPREIAEVMAERTQSAVVQVIGKKIVLYKESKNKKKIVLP